MGQNDNPFEAYSGSGKLGTPKYLALWLLVILFSAFLISKVGVTAGMGLIVLPFVVLYVYLLFQYPVIGLYSAIAFGFVLLGIPRYAKAISQIGMAMDGILFLTFFAFFLKRFWVKIDWTPAIKDITILAAIWFGYAMFQFFNPEVRDRQAWLAGMRGMSLYMLLIVPLVLLFITDRRKLYIFFYIWGFFSILATMKGLICSCWLWLMPKNSCGSMLTYWRWKTLGLKVW